LSNCRLTDARPFKAAGEWQAITYPATPSHGFTNAGTVDVAVVFVDFPDVAGGSAELSEHIAEIKKSAEWYPWFSQGNVKYNLRIADRWVRAPKTSENYFWLHPGKPGRQLMSDIEIATTYRSLAGSVVDTTGVTTVWAVLPKAITAVDEGFAYRGYPGVFSIGSDSYRARTPIWQHFVHETLHSHGALGHIRSFTEECTNWIVLEYRFSWSHAELVGRNDARLDEAREHLLRVQTESFRADTCAGSVGARAGWFAKRHYQNLRV